MARLQHTRDGKPYISEDELAGSGYSEFVSDICDLFARAMKLYVDDPSNMAGVGAYLYSSLLAPYTETLAKEADILRRVGSGQEPLDSGAERSEMDEEFITNVRSCAW